MTTYVSRFFQVLIPVLFFSLFLVTHLYAWPVINGLPICTLTTNQQYPTTASDGSGGAIITWQDYRNDTTGQDALCNIYAQRVNSTGSTLWTLDGLVICNAANSQFYPTIVSDGTGGAIITWADFRNGYGIYAQRVNSTGSTLWIVNGVAICTVGDYKNYPQIVSDGSGGAIITWYEFRSGANYDIYSQRVNSSGSTLWTHNGVAICTAANSQYYPKIVSDGSGGAIITWYDFRSGTDEDIYAQRVDSTGNPLWTLNGVAVCTAPNMQEFPNIANDGFGGAIITWNDGRNGSSYNIYAQRVNSTGSTLWTVNGVTVSTSAGDKSYTMLLNNGSGGAIITWQSYINNDFNIYAQEVDSTGISLWTTNGVAICIATNYQQYPTLVSDGSGGAIIAWYDARSGVSFNIYAQRVNSSGSTLWSFNGKAVCTAAYGQNYPTIVSDGSGGAIITWADYRNGVDYDLYAQQVNSNGLVPVHDWINYAGDKSPLRRE